MAVQIDKSDPKNIARSQAIAAGFLAQAAGFVNAETTLVYETDPETGEERVVERCVSLKFKYQLSRAR